MLRRFAGFLCVALFACGDATPQAASSSASTAAAEPAPDHWLGLEPGAREVTPFRLGIPDDLADVQARFARAAAQNQDWLQRYIAELDLLPGAQLPYHPNLGVGKEEYARLVEAYEHPGIIEEDKVRLQVRVEDGALRFSAPAPIDALASVAIERSGRLRYRDAVVIPLPQRIDSLTGRFGTWTGFSWRHDASNPAQQAIDTLDVALGRVDSRRFIQLSRRRGDSVRIAENVELLVWLD